MLGSRRDGAHEVALTLPSDEWRDAFSGEAILSGAVRLNLAGGRLLLDS